MIYLTLYALISASAALWIDGDVKAEICNFLLVVALCSHKRCTAQVVELWTIVSEPAVYLNQCKTAKT